MQISFQQVYVLHGTRPSTLRYIHDKMKKAIIIITILMVSSISFAADTNEIQITHIFPKECKGGLHKQPNGPFAVYVFCDDALGSNISVLKHNMHNPISNGWSLTKRFWQSDEWGADVTSFVWLPDGKHLIISTSEIYGTGSVYKLNLEKQSYSEVVSRGKDICFTELVGINSEELTIKLTKCDRSTSTISIKY